MARTLVWRGTGTDEKGYDAKDNTVLVEVDPRYFRPTEVDMLMGDPTNAREKLGWQHRTTFTELVSEMVASDLAVLKKRGRP